MKKILFICMGNTCRSPMAEMILKEKMRKLNLNYDISSCGINAYDGVEVSELTKVVLEENNIPVEDFKSKAIDEPLLEKSDYIFCMTKAQSILLKRFNNVYFIGDFVGRVDIIDPFGGPKNLYETAFNLLSKACDRIILFVEH